MRRQPEPGHLDGLVRGAARPLVQHGALLQGAHDGAEPLGDGGRPVLAGRCGVGRRAQLGGRAGVVGAEHGTGGAADPPAAPHRAGHQERDEHERGDDGEHGDERAHVADRDAVRVLEQPAQPVEEPLREAGLLVVDRLRELPLQPLPRLLGVGHDGDLRPHEQAGRDEGPRRHREGSPAARASSTSRPSRRIRTSM
ncbi:hypothetical protein [Cellulomonas endometrii]|uniref:hypothetical protein n=1 Tax=Cellulomonas endometrii TaxID=3036301 RepID=UPI0024AD0A36|nr:hypothetical protein [Cellulomonas endometrii]